ncbi:hypothetical protein Q1695_001037 [Nippostrongylus brasiliensis]|nr:hypothetical protein Q1695_001037 [Nippostrongylus brasiliensis]
MRRIITTQERTASRSTQQTASEVRLRLRHRVMLNSSQSYAKIRRPLVGIRRKSCLPNSLVFSLRGLERPVWSTPGVRSVTTRVGSEEDVFSFAYVARDRLEALRRLSGGSGNRFALDLKKEVYMDDPKELALNIGKRVKSVKRVDCIRAGTNVERRKTRH